MTIVDDISDVEVGELALSFEKCIYRPVITLFPYLRIIDNVTLVPF